MRHSVFHHAGTTREITSEFWSQLIIDGGYEAVIFDCDGTLVDSSEAHFLAFQSAVRTQGYTMERSWYEARTGLDRHSTLVAFSKSVTGPFNTSLAVNDSIAAFIRGRANVGPICETVELVKFFRSSLKLAVVTNSEDVVAAASLNQIGLHGHFGHIFSISTGLPPKPAPDLFIAAANAMMVSSDKALILEDSNEGVRAGLMAGHDVVQIMPRHVLDTKDH
jgi:beta-phosphoglucomutase-like phosphatase (HAD superfamily)